LYTLLKSEVGSFPEPVFPRGIDLRLEDRKARHRLYPVTVIYSVYFSVLSALSFRSGHRSAALIVIGSGAILWTPIEYVYHRYVLHGVFPKRGGLLARALHYFFDASHADHHVRPWDGMYINGHLDSLFAAAVFFPLSFLAPVHTVPLFLATVFVFYAFEEWTHHAMHFWNFRWSYFQYLRRRHLYHHSRHGAGRTYGMTSGVWDVVFGTRIGAAERQMLSLRPRIPVREAYEELPVPPVAGAGGDELQGHEA
jgi:sterol desaturase/sphingolipid hydroxylase (fatty acid hydroxylase superfamily)